MLLWIKRIGSFQILSSPSQTLTHSISEEFFFRKIIKSVLLPSPKNTTPAPNIWWILKRAYWNARHMIPLLFQHVFYDPHKLRAFLLKCNEIKFNVVFKKRKKNANKNSQLTEKHNCELLLSYKLDGRRIMATNAEIGLAACEYKKMLRE